MAQRDLAWTEHPTPLIDPRRCDGCGLCVAVCPGGALAIGSATGIAEVARPQSCHYTGLCEAVCPAQAIARPFEVVMEPGSGKPT